MASYSQGNAENCIRRKRGDFKIQGLTRLGEDACYKTTRNKSSMGQGYYQLDNYHECECEAPTVADVAYEYPTINYRDGYGWTSMYGCNIDNDSKLRNAYNLTNPRLKQQLFERPYLTTPYMGRGINDVCVEDQLRGEDTFQHRPCNNLAGVYVDRFTPQIDCLRQNIQNPIHIIPEDNDKNWIWGGVPSRQVIRNNDYLERCGYRNDGNYWVRI